MSAVSEDVPTVTIPKVLWDESVAKQSWFKQQVAGAVVIREGSVSQFAWWIKAGVALGALYLVVKYGGKALKV